MMTRMKYKDYVATHPDPILSVSDEVVQSAVYDWFKYRYIGFSDVDKFSDILRRNVAINYPIYQQKLRIEPGKSQYDWLVSNYQERQLKTKGSTTGSTTYGGLITTTGEGTATDIRTGSQTDTKAGTDTGIKSGSESSAKTGTDTAIKSGSENSAKGGTDTHTKTGTESIDRQSQDTNVKTGGSTATDIAGLHTTTTSPHVATQTSEDGGDHAWSGDTQISAVNPMSKQYDKFIEPSSDAEGTKEYYQKAYQHMPSGLDWSTLSTQGQSGHREYHDSDHKTTTKYIYDDGVKGDIQTTEGSSKNPDTHKVVYDDETDKREGSGEDTHTYDTQDTQSYGATDTHTYNNVTDTQNYGSTDTHTYHDVTDRQTHDATDTLTYNNVTDTHTKNDNGTQSHTGTDSQTGSDERTDREQITGRGEDPATLLLRATSFIEQSSAFKWFKEQIDYCFAPWYDEDGGLI